MIQAGVITLSDKGSRGEREDLSGPEAIRMLREVGIETVHSEIVPDEAEIIAEKLVEFADVRGLDLVVTTGGTGRGFLSPTYAGELFGPGKLLDTARYYIILPDGIGHGGRRSRVTAFARSSPSTRMTTWCAPSTSC